MQEKNSNSLGWIVALVAVGAAAYFYGQSQTPPAAVGEPVYKPAPIQRVIVESDPLDLLMQKIFRD